MARIILSTIIGVAALLASADPLSAQQPSAGAGHVPAATASASTQAHDHAVTPSPAAKPDIDALVAKMNAATGTARIDAMAEVLTALAQKHKDCETKMAGMMSHMGGHSAKQEDSPAAAP